MARKDLSRRDFVRIAGASAAGLPALSRLGGLNAVFAQEVTNIVFGGWGATAEDEGVQAAIEVFEAENPHITVEWQITPVASDYMQVLYTNLAANVAPDTSFIVSDDYESLRRDGILMDITDQIKNDPLLGQPNYFLEPQETQRCADENGRWHGIGSTWVAPHFYYNAELFDEMGIEPPGFQDDQIWEWDEFVEIAKQFTVDSNGRHPDDSGFDPDDIQRWGVDWPLWWIPIASAVHSNGGQFITDEGLIGFDSPEALEALQRLQDLIFVHHVAPRSASFADLGMSNTQMIDSGRLAMGVDGSWALSWMNPSTMTSPMGTGGLPKMVQPASLMQAHFHCILSTTQHPEAAWEWIRFLATPFYQTHFAKIGLWLPNQTAMLTEEGLKTWLTEGIHPDNYAELVTDYLPKYGFSLRQPPGMIEANANYMNAAYEALANGEPIEETFVPAVRQANEVLRAAQNM
ncbi:MAG TPA: sugar ABC transporter substrate-binding protein [Spirillospora sp.]|nr:sugar ABC transporter substrate-binding protein [Spirillospora sp.]